MPCVSLPHPPAPPGPASTSPKQRHPPCPGPASWTKPAARTLRLPIMSRMLWWLEMMTQGWSTSSFRRPLTSKRRPYRYLKDRMYQLMILRGEDGTSERRPHRPGLGGLGRGVTGQDRRHRRRRDPAADGAAPPLAGWPRGPELLCPPEPSGPGPQGDGEGRPASHQPDGSTASGDRRPAKRRVPTSTPTPQDPALTPRPCLLNQVRAQLAAGEPKTPWAGWVWFSAPSATEVPVPLWRLGPHPHTQRGSGRPKAVPHEETGIGTKRGPLAGADAASGTMEEPPRRGLARPGTPRPLCAPHPRPAGQGQRLPATDGDTGLGRSKDSRGHRQSRSGWRTPRTPDRTPRPSRPAPTQGCLGHP